MYIPNWHHYHYFTTTVTTIILNTPIATTIFLIHILRIIIYTSYLYFYFTTDYSVLDDKTASQIHHVLTSTGGSGVSTALALVLLLDYTEEILQLVWGDELTSPIQAYYFAQVCIGMQSV